MHTLELCIGADAAHPEITADAIESAIAADIADGNVALDIAQAAIARYIPYLHCRCAHNRKVAAYVAKHYCCPGAILDLAIAPDIAHLDAHRSAHCEITAHVF